MKYSLIIAMLSSLTFGLANAATLTPKRGVDILYINGQSAESKIGENEISEGFNQVVLRMNKNMSRGSSSDVFTSKPFAISFNVTGEEVVIDHPVARSINEAQRAFEGESPKWFVKIDGKLTDYEQSMIEGKTGFLPFSGLEKRVAEHNAKRGIYFSNGQLVDKPVEAQAIAVAATTTAAVTSTSSKVEKASPAKPVASSNVDQLKAWYLKSSKEERKAFRRWMIDQE
ncbi:YccT family protein [Vibrio sp. M260118]|uniref:YccT family protein n=1 Tax=Vibrio sp. M260118 TaxID=3020896 RepID=UPI002F427E8C